MAVIVIFVEGADTEPDPLPVYFLDNQDHATLICEGLKESEYRIFNFSTKHCTRSDRGRFAAWAKMAIDARDGVYGSNAAGIYDMIDEAHAIISQRRVHQEPMRAGAVEDPDTTTETQATQMEKLYNEIVGNSRNEWKQNTQFANKAWRARKETRTAFANDKGFYKELSGWVLFKKLNDRWHTLKPEPSYAEKVEKFFKQQKP